MRIYYDLKHQQQVVAQTHNDDLEVPCTHFIETAPSLLQEMPWVLHMDYKVQWTGRIFLWGLAESHHYIAYPGLNIYIYLLYSSIFGP